MKRRDFIKAGAAVGTISASAPSCAVLRGSELLGQPQLSEGEMSGLLAALDRGLEQISLGSYASKVARSSSPDSNRAHARPDEIDDLGRKALRMLLLTGTVQDLSPADQQHPGVQERLRAHLPEMDEAVHGMAGMLASLTAAEQARIRRRLEREPDLGVQISEQLDLPAREAGAPMSARLKMRTILTHTAWRMRVQSPSLLIGEYQDKVRRVVARSGEVEEIRRLMATRMSEDAFWRHQEKLARTFAAGQGGPVGAPAAGSPGTATPAPSAPPARGAPEESLPRPAETPGGPDSPQGTGDKAPGAAEPPTGSGAPPDGSAGAPASSAPLPSAPPPAAGWPEGSAAPAPSSPPSPTRSTVPSWPFSGGTGPVYRPGPPSRRPSLAEQQECEEDANDTMVAGGIVMGTGAVLLGVGGIIIGVSDGGGAIGGAIVMTVGGILLLAGIITLAVGGGVKAGCDEPD